MRLAELRLRLEDSIVFAFLSGDVDMSNAEELRNELSVETPNHALGLILDLSDVDYLDSAGIHLIHRLRESLRARGQKLRLVIPPDSLINDTMRLAGMEWEGDIEETINAARRALAPNSLSGP